MKVPTSVKKRGRGRPRKSESQQTSTSSKSGSRKPSPIKKTSSQAAPNSDAAPKTLRLAPGLRLPVACELEDYSGEDHCRSGDIVWVDMPWHPFGQDGNKEHRLWPCQVLRHWERNDNDVDVMKSFQRAMEREGFVFGDVHYHKTLAEGFKRKGEGGGGPRAKMPKKSSVTPEDSTVVTFDPVIAAQLPPVKAGHLNGGHFLRDHLGPGIGRGPHPRSPPHLDDASPKITRITLRTNGLSPNQSKRSASSDESQQSSIPAADTSFISLLNDGLVVDSEIRKKRKIEEDWSPYAVEPPLESVESVRASYPPDVFALGLPPEGPLWNHLRPGWVPGTKPVSTDADRNHQFHSLLEMTTQTFEGSRERIQPPSWPVQQLTSEEPSTTPTPASGPILTQLLIKDEAEGTSTSTPPGEIRRSVRRRSSANLRKTDYLYREYSEERELERMAKRVPKTFKPTYTEHLKAAHMGTAASHYFLRVLPVGESEISLTPQKPYGRDAKTETFLHASGTRVCPFLGGQNHPVTNDTAYNRAAIQACAMAGSWAAPDDCTLAEDRWMSSESGFGAVLSKVFNTNVRKRGPDPWADHKAKSSPLTKEESGSLSFIDTQPSAAHLRKRKHSPDDPQALGSEVPTPGEPAISQVRFGAERLQIGDFLRLVKEASTRGRPPLTPKSPYLAFPSHEYMKLTDISLPPTDSIDAQHDPSDLIFTGPIYVRADPVARKVKPAESTTCKKEVRWVKTGEVRSVDRKSIGGRYYPSMHVAGRMPAELRRSWGSTEGV
ncbi:hypothetical protein DFJ77DRAFT_445573, partial [Powellomyces hirtus]